MDTVNPGRRFQTSFAAILVLIGITIYASHRQQVFELLASGTQWVLVTCGFIPEGENATQDERLRNLYYAVRMYNETPAKKLSAQDQLAADLYPESGFGLIHTFDTKPVSAVIGGWLFAIPCTYFVDSRDCSKSLTTARLKVSVADFETIILEPISIETIEQFLANASPEIIRITLTGLETWTANGWQNNSGDNGYQFYRPPEPTNSKIDNSKEQLLCTETQWAIENAVMDHCLLRFQHGDNTLVELIFAANHVSKWVAIKSQAAKLVSRFQVRQ